MSETVPAALLQRLSDFVSVRMGLHFPPERWSDLRKGLASAAAEFGFDDPSACAEWFLSTSLDGRQIAVLASDLTVGETYFFREKKSFEVLEREIVPSLIHRRRGIDHRLRIWSAGCCTGEEAYSLAILLSRLLPDHAHWDIRLLATDINPRFLRTAAQGVFGEWSFRDAPPGLKENYFTHLPSGRFQVKPEIREMVQFDYLNLADDVFPALLNGTTGFDLILCRNVLIYMVPRQIEAMVGKFARALVDGGWLVVGAAETSHVSCSALSVVNCSGMTAYLKREHEPIVARSVARIGPSLPDLLPSVGPILRSVRTPTAAQVETKPSRRLVKPDEVLAKALALYGQGHYAEAVGALLPLTSQNPIPASALTLLTRACANMGDLSQAIHWVEQALTADRMNPHLHYLCGVINQELAGPSEAAASFRRAIYLDPDFIMAHFALGHLSLQQGRVPEGVRHFDNALRLLNACEKDALVPESEGMSAGRLAEIITHLKDSNLARNEVP